MRDNYNPSIGQSSPENADYRLPKNVKPTHYDLHLEPDLENGSFGGSVVIHFDVLQDTKFILLNSDEIKILTTVLVQSSGKSTKIESVHYHELQQTIMIPLPESIPAGSKIRIRQTFKGRLNSSKKMSGFNRSRYIGRDGKPKWFGSTQGQPTGIRQIFPCADEPGLKATFSSALIVDQGLTALSNMDIASEEKISSDKKKVVFNKTPLMSTYLVAFVVGELNYIESNDYRVPVRIYATPDRDIKQGAFCVDVGARAMISHEKTFGSPYPLPKLDMVAVPGHAGAMENWGCVIYGEQYLVSDESDASAKDNLSKAYVVTHELAHQWFGNIVTPSWWDSIWLNESFADWATYNAATHIWPEWEPWSEFVAGHPNGALNAYQSALALDSNRGSHPIEVPVNTPSQISQIFDSITYAKGCTILRMISELLGVEVFIEGVRLHLKRHAFGNATTNDLWDSLGTVSGQDVQKIISIWTQKVGYPVLSITEDEKSKTIEILQHRFLQSGKVPPEADRVLYPVYLKTKTQQGIDQKSQLSSREDTFPVDLEFYKLNAGQTGLYRVSYPLSRWKNLGQQLYSSGLLSPNDRVGLISDLRAVATAGQTEIHTSHLFAFLSHFKNEGNYFVWRQILVCLQDICGAWLFEDSSTLAALKRFQADLMSKVLGDLGQDLWSFKPGESYKEQSFKAVLFGNAAGYEIVKLTASYLFDQFMDGDTKAVNPNIRKAVFRIVLSDPKLSDNDDNYNKLLHVFRTTSSLGTRSDVIKALGHATCPTLVQKTLDFANSTEVRTTTDRNAIFSALSGHQNGIDALWKYLTGNWDEIVGERGGIMGGRFVGFCVQGFTREGQLREVEAFLKRQKGNGVEKFEKFLEQSLDAVRAKVGWVERDRKEVRDWLRANGYYEDDS
ncbi:puromycin-sensitive aminopeptidase [Hyaloscypha sp. PMI_1271]|nr:puromycin-sensitive aminopeptidase [Hyaloscypha sp. PMI_1271]